MTIQLTVIGLSKIGVSIGLALERTYRQNCKSWSRS